MYERMLDKTKQPAEDEIEQYIGEQRYLLFGRFEDFLQKHYQLVRVMKFPFGNQYGWSYKYSHKTSHLCYAFFENGAFTVSFQLGDPCIAKLETLLPGLSDKTNELWRNRYPCGKSGGWLHYRVMEPQDLEDIMKLIQVKKRPQPLVGAE